LDNYTKNGDPADLAEAVSTIQSETENEASEQRFGASYRKASALMKQSLAGTGLDPAGEELAEVRAVWQQGRTAKDSVSLFEAAAMANTVALQAFRTQATGQTSSKNPDLDMAIPRNGSGAEVSDQEIYNRYGRGEVNRTKVVIDAAKRLGLPI
jgi:pyruvate/2-oxoglutarate dehydrogenase complex dihydrolipoamide acyltransferase (E2) component